MTRVRMVEQKAPGWKFKLTLTVLILAVGLGTAAAYRVVQGPLEAQMSVRQLNDSNADYVVGSFFARSDIPGTITHASWGLVVLIWLVYGAQWARFYIGSREQPADGPPQS